MRRKDDDASYLWDRCYRCGHWLRFASTGCPQCGVTFDGRADPKRWPNKCDCERCRDMGALAGAARALARMR